MDNQELSAFGKPLAGCRAFGGRIWLNTFIVETPSGKVYILETMARKDTSHCEIIFEIPDIGRGFYTFEEALMAIPIYMKMGSEVDSILNVMEKLLAKTEKLKPTNMFYPDRGTVMRFQWAGKTTVGVIHSYIPSANQFKVELGGKKYIFVDASVIEKGEVVE